MVRRLSPLLAAVALCACPPPPVDVPDAAVVDAGVDALADCLSAPAPPAPAATADWVCPAGWNAVPAWTASADDTASIPKVCEPPPLPPTCPDGTRAAVGSSACAPIGDPCPTGDFPAIAPGTGVLFVKAGATGGDGSSPASPLGTIFAALAASTAGSTIVVAKGTYTEYLPVTRAVTILGACATGTIITAPSRDANKGTVDLGAAATLQNLQITGPRVGAWVLKNTAPATLRGVLIQSAERVGVYVSDRGQARLENVLITQTLPDPANNQYGRGLQVRTGGQVTAKGLTLEKNRDVAITLDGAGCTAELEDVVVRNTASELASRAYGQGMEVRYGAAATITRGVFEKNRNTEIVSDQPGTQVTLIDTLLQDTLSTEANRTFGGGLEAKLGVAVKLTRTTFRRHQGTAVRLGGAGTTLEGTDVRIADTAPQASDQMQGLGLALDQGATAVLHGGLLVGNRTVSVLLADPDTRADLFDSVVRGTQAQASDGLWGVAIVGMGGAELRGARVRLEHEVDSGLFLQTGAQATLDDLVIRDTGEGPPPAVGEGVVLQSASRATLHRVSLEANRRAALYASALSAVQVTDLSVVGTRADAQGHFGRGLNIQGGAAVALQRATFEEVREAGLFASEPGTTLTVDQVSVRNTRPAATELQEGRALSVENGASTLATCFESRGNREVAAFAFGDGTRLQLSRGRLLDTTGVEGFGDGVVVRDGAVGTLEDVEVRGSQVVGIGYSNASGTIARGRVVGNPVGLMVSDGATLAEVAQVSPTVGAQQVQVDSATVFEGNTTRISATTVPLPPGLGSTPARPQY